MCDICDICGKHRIHENLYMNGDEWTCVTFVTSVAKHRNLQ